MKRLASFFALLPLLAACSAGYLPGSTDGGTTSPDGGTSSGNLKLRSIETQGTAKVGSTSAKGGSFFASIHVELTNSSTAATPMRFPQFSLEVEGGTSYNASTATSQVTGGCIDAVSVEPNGKHDCWVAFEIPTTKPAKVLHYRAADASDVTVAVSVSPPSTEGKLACDYARVASVIEVCSSCIQTNCGEPANVYLSNECSVGTSCTTSPYCTCERNALSTSTCKSAYDAVQTCIAQSCSECIATLSGQGG